VSGRSLRAVAGYLRTPRVHSGGAQERDDQQNPSGLSHVTSLPEAITDQPKTSTADINIFDYCWQ
jgi:hypothetical protein